MYVFKTWGGTTNTFILNLGTKWKWAVSFRFLSLDPRRGTARNHWIEEFYVYGSVHRWSILIIVQRDATQSSLFIILQVHSTCFGYQPHPSSGVHKTVTAVSGTVQLPLSKVPSLATLDRGSCTQNMTSTGDCSYSFVYSWWWVWLTPETRTVNSQNNK